MSGKPGPAKVPAPSLVPGWSCVAPGRGEVPPGSLKVGLGLAKIVETSGVSKYELTPVFELPLIDGSLRREIHSFKITSTSSKKT